MGKFFFQSRAPFHVCPSCEKPQLGVLMVNGQRCVRRCNGCDHSLSFELPKPNKKIIYLDQHAISLMAKVHVGRAPKEWADLRKALERAILMEAVICPHSEFHESESVVKSDLAEELRKLYNHFSLGDAFLTTYEIEMRQIARALKQFAGEPEKVKASWREVLRRDPHVWTPDHYITLNTGRLDNLALTARQVKEQIGARMPELNKAFASAKKAFKEQFRLEVNQVALNIVELYKRDIARLMACKSPGDLLMAQMQGSIFAEHMRHILAFFAERHGADAKWPKAMEFLQSKEFANIPYVRIGSALWAGLARRVGLGQAKVRVSDYNDVPTISHYAPFCDAMLIDSAMRDLVTTNPVRDCVQLSTAFFSAKSIRGFIQFLDRAVADRPAAIVTAVKDVHGEP